MLKKPQCVECGGGHEPSGARSDCITHWKRRAVEAQNALLVARIYKADKCADCAGSGAIDSGASDPAGNFYKQPCQTCSGTGRESFALLEWAVTLLCSATPNAKFQDEASQVEWARCFGRWFAETQEFIGKNRAPEFPSPPQ